MKVLILGGCGIQGRTAIYDLARDPEVKEIICADLTFDALDMIKPFTPMDKVRTQALDARKKENLISLYKEVDIVIDLLPKDFKEAVYEAALETRTPVVNTNYAHNTARLDEQAKEAGIAIMPECGLDPGIDLVIYGDAGRRFETLTLINSYCGGFPEKKACTNPLNYKISWIWRGVLSALNRSARIIKQGKIIDISAEDLFDKAFIHPVEVPGLGTLEAYPNGDAVFFTDLLGATPTIRETGRYSLRWPGWSDFWRPMKALGLVSESKVEGLGCSPLDLLDKCLGPKLQYTAEEKDLVVMVNVFEGIMDGKKTRLTSTMLIERDLETGIMAMSKGVGYTAAIVARMIAKGEILEKGVLSPTAHIPTASFLEALKQRGISIKEERVVLE
ncbi:saccharopine dehydrogenase family protein [Desulfospira joergensenii]|uniref:saccharopine dehydrogenase family protein n=1 Tax=Desulfospira joergensenii TaxID=53329 RepID=UPI0003B4F3C8|nr:saccharopine dehydrogenase C-terminal domain-containing protein [Desulfospira joergensenii]